MNQHLKHLIGLSAGIFACVAIISSCSKTETIEPPITDGEDSTTVTTPAETIEPPITDGEDSTTVTTPEEPSVILTEGPVSQTSISFTIIPENAEECAYLITEKEDGAEVPDAETIFKDGEHLEEIKSQLIEKDGMEAGTEYVVTAAVRNQDLTARQYRPGYDHGSDYLRCIRNYQHHHIYRHLRQRR